MKQKIYHGICGDTSTEFNNQEELEELIQDIMIKDGPDGHCDGADIMAEILWERIEELLTLSHN